MAPPKRDYYESLGVGKTATPDDITTAGLMQDQREVEIEHAGRIYRLRITQLNKLILTA